MAQAVWQTGTPSDNARDLPDISLFASNGFLNSYYLVCQSDLYGGSCSFGDFQGFGGTSVSSPQFAGIIALINQKTGSAQGIPDLKLYKLAAQQPSAFQDIPAGSPVAMPCTTGTPNCTTTTTGDTYGVLSGYNTASRYDLASGLGSVDIANLLSQWQSGSKASAELLRDRVDCRRDQTSMCVPDHAWPPSRCYMLQRPITIVLCTKLWCIRERDVIFVT